MNYEKAYKETIDKLRKLHNDWDSMQNRAAKDIELVFPELIESEDEKIRKDIVAAVETYGDFTQGRKEEIYAWLKKQDEQKLADKVEPKFKVGDWIVSNTNPNCVNSIMFIADYNNDSCSYLCRYRDGQMEYSYEFIENSYHLWTIHDAKDGDVLAYPDGTIVLFKYRLDGLNSGIYMSHILLATKIETCQSCAVSKDLHPATKEQSDLLFKKMKEAGYEWDIERKKLKKIESKSAWSEDDKCSSQIKSQKSRDGYIKALQEIESLPKVHGWIARDKDGLLGFYSDKPQRFDDRSWWCDPGCYTALALSPESYPEITWESEPFEVELIIRKL